ncbi:MAG: hypothetical protein ABIM99_04205, partial [Candidatus Dojkabacteria bacterium]
PYMNGALVYKHQLIDGKLNAEYENTYLETVKAGIRFITLFYGENQSKSFIELKLLQYLRIFYTFDRADFLMKFVYFDNYNSEEYEDKSKLGEQISSIRESSDINISNVFITQIISTIMTYDLRTAVVLLHVFGFMPWFITNNDFIKKFNLNVRFMSYHIEVGLSALFNDIKEDKLKNSDENSITSYLMNLKKLDADDMVRYTDGRLLASGNDIYRLARVIKSKGSLRLNLLTQTEKALIDVFSKPLEETGTFTRHEEISEKMCISEHSINKLVKRILNKLENDDSEYTLNLDGRIRNIDPESSYFYVIKKLKNQPEKSESPYLNIYQQNLLRKLKELQESGLNPSLTELAASLDVSIQTIRYTLDEAKERLELVRKKKSDIYFDTNGDKVLPENPRSYLIDKYEEETYRSRLRADEIVLLDLYMKRDKNVFIHNMETIATELQMEEGCEPDLYLRKIYRIVNKFKMEQVNYLDEEGKPIRLYHKNLIIAAQKVSYRNISTEGFTDFECDILNLILSLQPNGKYLSYLAIAYKMNCKVTKVSEVGRKLLMRLDPTES